MTVLNLNQRTSGNSTGEARPVLPTDIYRMKCIEAKMQDNTFEKPNKDGTMPQQIVLTFEMAQLTDDQQEAMEEADEDWSAVRIWHRFAPYYGDVKAGGPSKLKEFLDNLVAWGLIPTLDMETGFDLETLTTVELKCSVLQYAKTMGENAGKPGNKITGFAAVRAAKKGKNIPVPLTSAEEIQPAAVAAGVEEEDLPF